jgi:hypothetical protein
VPKLHVNFVPFAWVLNCQSYDVPVLVAARRLRRPHILPAVLLLFLTVGCGSRLIIAYEEPFGAAFRFLRHRSGVMVLPMNKCGKADPLVADIQNRLMPGSFLAHDEVLGFTTDLDRVHERLEALVKGGEAERAVRLYEIFLSGVYAKIEECDHESYLSVSFASAFCGWIKARQAAGRPADETVNRILNWMKNDNYGFCYEI